MAAFTAAGLAVSPHKVGPDYIDPGYHALATGRPGRNLDAYLCGPDLIAPLFAHGSAGCDLAVVEGVMGMYDGAAGQGELASTAHVAKLLRAPVVLVVDASSQSRSVAALVHGFASWDPEVRVAGVILNKVGSDRHETLLREALEESGVPVLGALRRVRQVRAPSRHLGLVPVAERQAEAVESVAALAAQVREGCDLEALLALARSAPSLPGGAWDPGAVPAPASAGGRAPRVAVAVVGVHLLLRRAHGAAHGGRGRGRAVRPAARRAAAGRYGRSRHRRRLPRGVRARAVRQPTAARGRGGAGALGGRPWPRSARGCCISPVSWTASRCAGSWMPRRGCRSG